MNCSNCGKQINYGYFWEGESVSYICTDCLLRYRNMNKYDRKQIKEMHAKGYGNKTIATVMGTNPITIAYILRKEEKHEQNNLSRRRVAEAEAQN